MIDEYLEQDIEPEIPEDWGYLHKDNLPNYDYIRDHVQGIVEAVYESGDVMKLESCLDEVCYELGVAINKGNPVIESKEKDLMQWHLEYQRKIIKQMRK